ncbi:Hypothetical protein SRAE_1000022100 [Strongyloides ratti]|uniref:Uncharacterized protein n=1 Tax=Strongyloides ratti TaxID=34506 RepID=A0A090KWQ9_STRRB|nr:Hypothetical protein SRAE_1000022100 [Strongyloides ratti]CEF61945.1 Hypothetical protein SRAE_1000022100 [Strongyloides ratti]
MVSLSFTLPILFVSSVNGFLWGCCSYSAPSYYVQPSGYYQPTVSYAYQPPTTYYMRVPIYAKISNLPSYPQPTGYVQPGGYSQPGNYPQTGGYPSSYTSIDYKNLYVQPGIDPNQLTNVVLYNSPTNNYITAPRVGNTYQQQPISQPISQPTQDSSYDPFPKYDNKVPIKTEVPDYSPTETTQQEEVYKIKNEPAAPYHPSVVTEPQAPYNPPSVTSPPYTVTSAKETSYIPTSNVASAPPGTNEPYKKKV